MKKIREVFEELEDSVFELSLKNELVFYDHENKYFARNSFKKRFLLQNSLYDGILIKIKDLDINIFDLDNENLIVSILPFFMIDNKTYIITKESVLSSTDITKAIFSNKKVIIFSFTDNTLYNIRGMILD